jgi:phosphoglycerol transferase MdoB-like AlkP superfamily enzyme
MYYLNFPFYTIILVPTLLKYLNFNNLLVTAILRPQKMAAAKETEVLDNFPSFPTAHKLRDMTQTEGHDTN